MSSRLPLALLLVPIVGFLAFAQAPPQPAAPGGQQSPALPAGAQAPQGRGTLSSTTNEGADFSPKAPIQALTPEEQAKRFVLPPGYRMELVAAEPDVISPAVIRFDGNGRMYVAEFITYMRDADGNRQHEPESRITRFESTKGDGVFDKRTVFVDRLVLPRTVVPLDGDSILTNETASDDIVKYTDTNGDGVADKREHFYSGIGLGRDGNLEHEQAGFVWGLDNWIYTTYNAFRFRWTPAGILKEPTGPNAGSWGVTMDDDGKIWFIDAGGERGPMNFQVPIHYGAFTLPDQYEPGFHTVWPEVGLSDTQGGMIRVRMPVGRLNHLTAASGADVVRAHRVPRDLVGDLLITEPVGRLIRRARIVKTEGVTQLRNVYPGSEFILSTDPLFRPINITTAPDGSIYIADMYHGIIQESNWTRPGSYLRRKIEQYQLDKIVSHGRIWRLRFDGVPGVPATPAGPAAQATPEIPPQPALALDAPPRMLQETPAQLVRHLTHANGWWRDTAQQLLIQRQDKSVVPALQEMVRHAENLTARFHALWTLEGLGALDASLVREQMKDANPRMRVQAIRASETLYKGANRTFADDYRAMAGDPDPDVALQALLTANLFKLPDVEALIAGTQASNGARGIQEIGKLMLQRIANAATTAALAFSPEQQAQMKEGETIYRNLCATCHGEDARGVALTGAAAPAAMMGPALAGSPRVTGHRDYVIKTLLHGMTGPLAGQTFTQVMLPMGAQDDRWVANIASFIRNEFGNSAPFVTPADVARVRAATAGRKAPWTFEELESGIPRLLPADPAWRASASHNADRAANGLTLAAWTTAVPQEPGMWYQVELPQAVRIAEVQFDSGPPGGARRTGRGRGAGGGRGAAGRGSVAPEVAAPPPPPVFGTFPTAYQVQVSLDGKSWSRPVAQGSGSAATTVAAFAPVRARFVRITQTGKGDAPWSVLNLRVYVAGS